MPKLINFNLLSNPLNWVIVVLMTIFLFCFLEVVKQLWATAPAAAE